MKNKLLVVLIGIALCAWVWIPANPLWVKTVVTIWIALVVWVIIEAKNSPLVDENFNEINKQ